MHDIYTKDEPFSYSYKLPWQWLLLIEVPAKQDRKSSKMDEWGSITSTHKWKGGEVGRLTGKG